MWGKMKMKKGRSKGWGKIVNAIYVIATSPSFQSELRKIRIKHEIPEKGFKFRRTADNLYEVSCQSRCSEWKYFETQDFEEYNDRCRAIDSDMRSIGRRYNLYYYGFIELITPFLFFSNISQKNFKTLADFHDSVVDVCHETSTNLAFDSLRRIGSIEKDSGLSAVAKEMKIREDEYYLDFLKQFPAMVGISRYASLSDTLDYIRKNWKSIRMQLWRDAVSDEGVMRVKTRITRERDEFIWANQHIRPRSRLADKVNRKFSGQIDAIYVRNIISRENKKRSPRNK